MPVEREWRVGLCVSCLEPLDPTKIRKRQAGFCSEHCRKQAENIRYIRQVIRDGRSADRMTAWVVYNDMINFLALDLAYTRPRLSDKIRRIVLAKNDGLCVNCNNRPATEVDHINGGSTELSNLRGLCRMCHEFKPRGKIPDDLTRDGAGMIDTSKQSQELLYLWESALYTHRPLDEALEWFELRKRAIEYRDTRFGWITEQILCDQPICPAHDGVHWRTEWRKYQRMYQTWAEEAVSREGRSAVGETD